MPLSNTCSSKNNNLGAAKFQNIINKTSKQGVSVLNEIQKNYSDIDIKTNPFFNGKQLGVVKARSSKQMLEPYYARLGQYVSDIFEAINGDVPDFQNDSKGGLNKADADGVNQKQVNLDFQSLKTNNAIKKILYKTY